MTSVVPDYRYAHRRGREIVALTVMCDTNPNRNVYDTSTPSGFGAHYGGVTLARLREMHGGDEFTRVSPTTGRTHRISLRPYADLDANTTYVEFTFHFYPAPFRSKEAQSLREIRSVLDSAIFWFDGKMQEREIAEGVAEKDRLPLDVNPRMVESSIRQAEAYMQLATSTAILTPQETWAIRREYAEQRPDVFRR